MRYIRDKIQMTCDTLWSISRKEIAKLPLEFAGPVDYKKGNTPPSEGWQPFEPGQTVQGRDAHFWFRTAFKTPATDCFIQCVTGYEGQWDATNPQGLIYLNGSAVQGCDTNHTEIYLEPDTEYVLHNYFYVGMIDTPVPLSMTLCQLDRAGEQLYYDMKVALDCCDLYTKGSDEWIAVMGVLEQTANLIDFRKPSSESYARSVEQAIAYIREELYHKRSCIEGKPVVHCVGHTHIDVEWRWARAQTREKIQRSFATAATLMKGYPEYKFMLSQPELYRYLKEEAPALYEQLKDLVKAGRWEPEGAMWVESDCNLISGESFIRQIMQGKRFFKEEFGVDCNILFLPDVFGYSAAMPQILKKCGIDYFVTSKISWNDTNTMPYDCFVWEGIDGSEIFTDFITTQRYKAQPERKTTYVGKLTPSEIKGTWHRFSQKEYARCALTTYGHGDGGGGPTKAMLETQRRLAKGLPGMPVTKMTFLREYLQETKRQFDKGCLATGRTPKWVGELYLEYHRGTYTSIAKNKRYNRKSEFLLQKSEALSYTDLLFGGSYDADGLYGNWNKVLHNQFHDIIPGSSIQEVYEGTDKDYAEVGTYCGALLEEKLQKLALGVQATEGLLVYNALGFGVKGPVNVAGKIVELSEEIPALGYTVITDLSADRKVQVVGNTAESPYYKLTLDEAGRILALYDKTAKRQVFKAGQCGNEIRVFEDRPIKYDAWEIAPTYRDKMWILADAAEILPVVDGNRAGFKVSLKYLDSTIVQYIWLYSESRRIDFETELDWQEKHQLVKVAFPLDVHTAKATYEIQFGSVERPTHQNTSWDAAQFEVYGHKWVDLSENGYGVSLLNDCKYGFSCEGSTLMLTWLKCATFPNPHADEGAHRFTYSLLPHAGDWREAGVIQQSYLLNQPLSVLPVTGGKGHLPKSFSLVQCDSPNVIVDTVKKAEADDGMVVRLYEAFDRRTTIELQVADGFTKAFLCDLLENEVKELDFTDGALRLPVKNFEIITLKFTK